MKGRRHRQGRQRRPHARYDGPIGADAASHSLRGAGGSQTSPVAAFANALHRSEARGDCSGFPQVWRRGSCGRQMDRHRADGVPPQRSRSVRWHVPRDGGQGAVVADQSLLSSACWGRDKEHAQGRLGVARFIN